MYTKAKLQPRLSDVDFLVGETIDEPMQDPITLDPHANLHSSQVQDILLDGAATVEVLTLHRKTNPLAMSCKFHLATVQAMSKVMSQVMQFVAVNECEVMDVPGKLLKMATEEACSVLPVCATTVLRTFESIYEKNECCRDFFKVGAAMNPVSAYADYMPAPGRDAASVVLDEKRTQLFWYIVDQAGSMCGAMKSSNGVAVTTAFLPADFRKVWFQFLEPGPGFCTLTSLQQETGQLWDVFNGAVVEVAIKLAKDFLAFDPREYDLERLKHEHETRGSAATGVDNALQEFDGRNPKRYAVYMLWKGSGGKSLLEQMLRTHCIPVVAETEEPLTQAGATATSVAAVTGDDTMNISISRWQAETLATEELDGGIPRIDLNRVLAIMQQIFSIGNWVEFRGVESPLLRDLFLEVTEARARADGDNSKEKVARMMSRPSTLKLQIWGKVILECVQCVDNCL